MEKMKIKSKPQTQQLSPVVNGTCTALPSAFSAVFFAPFPAVFFAVFFFFVIISASAAHAVTNSAQETTAIMPNEKIKQTQQSQINKMNQKNNNNHHKAGNSNAKNINKTTLLFNYYSAPIAIIGEALYEEITIEQNNNGSLYLHLYAGNRSKGTTTNHSIYKTDAESLNEVMNIVRRYQISEWNQKRGIGMTGRLLVVKFHTDNGKMIRVSSENIPYEYVEKVMQIFQAIAHSLRSHIKEENRVQ